MTKEEAEKQVCFLCETETQELEMIEIEAQLEENGPVYHLDDLCCKKCRKEIGFEE